MLKNNANILNDKWFVSSTSSSSPSCSTSSSLYLFASKRTINNN